MFIRAFDILKNKNVSWYCIHTRSRHEEMVHRGLEKKNINSFLPKLEVWSRRKDRRKKIQKPIFPGYLFVYEIMDSLHRMEILKTPGVVKILGNERGPLSIPDSQIESIKIVLSGKSVPSSCPYLKIGQMVRVIDGPLEGCNGILKRIRGERDRLIISVDLLQRSIAVEIDGASVESIK